MSDLPLLFADVARWYAESTVALGIRTGLSDALLAGGGTATELAASAQVDADNAARWAGAMVTGGYATLVEGRYAPVEDALGLLRGGATLDVRAIVELLVPLGALLPRVELAIRNGAGISSAEFQAALGVTAERVNAPMYERLLRSEWIAGHPELEAALVSGIDVAEVGPGGGTALRILARAFPNSRFVGFEVDRGTVLEANAAATAAGLGNLQFEVLDASELPRGAFDLVCMFDAFHHMTEPGVVMGGIRAALRPGGGDRLWLRPSLLLSGEQGGRQAGDGRDVAGARARRHARAARVRGTGPARVAGGLRRGPSGANLRLTVKNWRTGTGRPMPSGRARAPVRLPNRRRMAAELGGQIA